MKQVRRDYDNPVVMISENGAAFADTKVVDGLVQDDDRIEYLASHLGEARRAIQDGVKLEGYFLWSLMDNFEWSFGYTQAVRHHPRGLPYAGQDLEEERGLVPGTSSPRTGRPVRGVVRKSALPKASSRS